jgi:ribonuclease G
MGNLLLITVSPWDRRAALLENGRLAELYLERRHQPDPTANIYRGRVVKVLPGMDAAFVDIGRERPAYLFVDEVAEQWDSFFNFWLEEESPEAPKVSPAGPPAPIEDLLREGQDLLVQICRPPLGGKGARLTTHITLPGYYLVYAPTLTHVGVSRRIVDQAERERLLGVLKSLKPTDGGLIARTVSLGQGEAALRRELDALVSLWNTIKKRETGPTPFLLHPDLDFPQRLVRELCGPEVDRLIIDDFPTYEQVAAYASSLNASLKNRVEFYTGAEPLFAAFGLDTDWRRLLDPKVWLKSGGYLHFGATEALTAVDVNTGRFIGRRHLEDTILKTNLEAAEEIARQLRLRNLGGLIVIDFIDMKKAAHRDAVHRALLEALKTDRAKTSVLPISSLGLVEMTRERLREPLAALVTEPCRCCDGMGFQLSPLVIAHDILRQLAAEVREFPGCRVTVSASPEVTAQVAAAGEPDLNRLAQEHHCDLKLVEEPDFPRERYEITREMKL